MPVTIEEQVKCVRREIGMRERVYPRRVESGKMRPEVATYETEAMKAVLATLERIAADARLI